MQIGYTIVDSPLGRLLVATTARGVCAVSLGDDDAHLERALHATYARDDIVRDDQIGDSVDVILAYLKGQTSSVDLPLDVRATPFQHQVWQALLAIPYGETRTYMQIADSVGNRKAVRAVGRACAMNPVSLVVPCHRVVGSDGTLHGFGWGLDRKQALLDMEKSGRDW